MARNAKIAKVRQDRCASPRGSPLGARRLTGGGKEAKSHGRKEHGADHLCAVPEQPVCSSSVEQMMTCNASKGTYACFCTRVECYTPISKKTKFGPQTRRRATHRHIIHDQRQVYHLPGHLCPPRSASLAARQRPPGPHQLGCPPPLHAQALARGAVRLPSPNRYMAFARFCFCKNNKRTIITEQSAVAQPAQPSAQAEALLPTRAHTCRLTQAPRTTATASSSYRNSTAFIWHSSGVRCPPRCLPALRTSRPSSPRSPSSLPSAVSRSSSPRIERPSRPCVSTTPARGSRSSVSFTSPSNTRTLSQTPLFEWR
jgi:hypothetical protein